MSTNYLGPNVHGIASPAAAVPEGALPPLPEGATVMQLADEFGSGSIAYTAKQVREIVRAAVEADRAQRPQAMSNADAAAWARANGLNVPAAWDGAVTDYGSPVDNSADRAQQGEPVAWVWYEPASEWNGYQGRERIAFDKPKPSASPNGCRPLGYIDRAATKAAAPADAPSGKPLNWYRIRKAVEALYDTAKQYHGEPDLRTRIRMIVVDFASGTAPVPDTGIPTAGEVELRAALKPFADAYAPEAERVALFYTPDDLAKYGDAFDRNTVTPTVTMGDFRRAYEAFRAPVSSTPTDKDQA